MGFFFLIWFWLLKLWIHLNIPFAPCVNCRCTPYILTFNQQCQYHWWNKPSFPQHILGTCMIITFLLVKLPSRITWLFIANKFLQNTYHPLQTYFRHAEYSLFLREVRFFLCAFVWVVFCSWSVHFPFMNFHSTFKSQPSKGYFLAFQAFLDSFLSFSLTHR